MENTQITLKIIPSSQTSWIGGKCIGRGSFGSVRLATMKLSGEIFAVKSTEYHIHSTSPQVEAIENEIRILKSLSSSPHIVKYLGDDFTADSMVQRNLHLEYMPGGTVADFDHSLFGLKDERVVRSYTYCILSALSYLHAKRIAHCDVKGKNILIGHVAGMCKLADFGSAIQLSDKHHNKTPVISRGSPLWMAPEVVRQEYQGTESDIWSLGCTVIEMITGRPAWKSDQGVNNTLNKIGFSDELPEFPVQLSECGRDFLTKCLRRDHSERWSCDQLLQHPFVSQISTTKVPESSPRCVLDLIDNEFSDRDEEKTIDNGEISAKRRISELATSSGAIWETECWTVVRGEGTSSVYSISREESMENERVKLERLMLRLFRNACVYGEFGKCWFIAGWSCRHGLYCMISVKLMYIRFYYCRCTLKLLIYLMIRIFVSIFVIFLCLFCIAGCSKPSAPQSNTNRRV